MIVRKACSAKRGWSSFQSDSHALLRGERSAFFTVIGRDCGAEEEGASKKNDGAPVRTVRRGRGGPAAAKNEREAKWRLAVGGPLGF
jgi:hypothetical protein